MRFTAAFILCLVFTSCKKSGSDSEPASPVVTVSFAHVAGGDTLTFDGSTYTNAAGNEYAVTKLQYILTDMYLQQDGEDATRVFSEKFVDADLNVTDTAVATAAGEYSGISFVFGVRNDVVLSETTDFDNMEWPGAGYHYMKFEGSYLEGAGKESFLVHTGPTVGVDYSVKMTLAVPFTLTDSKKLTLTMDVNQWFRGSEDYDFRTYSGMIMGNSRAQSALKSNGTDVFSGAVE